MITRELMPVVQAFEYATGRKPNPATIWRWTTKGSNGVKLQIERVGGRNLCSVEMVNHFIDECTAAKNTSKPKLDGEKDRSSSIAKAKAKLSKLTSGKAK